MHKLLLFLYTDWDEYTRTSGARYRLSRSPDDRISNKYYLNVHTNILILNRSFNQLIRFSCCSFIQTYNFFMQTRGGLKEGEGRITYNSRLRIRHSEILKFRFRNVKKPQSEIEVYFYKRKFF